MARKDPPRSFSEHLFELRSRVLIQLLTVILISGVSFYFYPQIINFLTLPLQKKLFFTSPGGGLELMVKVSLLCGIILSLPVFLYQFLKFIEPALPPKLNLRIILYTSASLLLTLIGAGFGYFLGLPSALNFLAGFSSDQIQPLITTNEYFSFVNRYLLGFAIVFQLPLLLYLINTLYSVKAGTILKYQRIVIVLSLIIAAVLTPTPDLFNQAL